MQAISPPFNGGLITLPIAFVAQATDPSYAAGYGSLYTKTSGTTELYYENSAGTVTQLTGGAGGSTLQAAYNGGSTINTSSGVPVTISNTSNSGSGLPALQLTVTPSSFRAGDGLDILMNTNSLGSGITVACAGTSGQTGILVDNGVGGSCFKADGRGGSAVGFYSYAEGGVAFYTQNTGPAGGGMTGSAPGLKILQTWNAGGVAFQGILLNVTNTASAPGSQLLTIQQGGVNALASSVSGGVEGWAAGTSSLTLSGANGASGGILELQDLTAAPTAQQQMGGIFFFSQAATQLVGSIAAYYDPAGTTDSCMLTFGTRLHGNASELSVWTMTPVGNLVGLKSTVLGWNSSATDSRPGTGGAAIDTGFSRTGAATVALGNGTQGDVTGALNLATLTTTGRFTKYNNVATAGWGVPAIYGAANITAQSAAATIASYANPAADGTFEVAANVNVSAATSLSAPIQVSYTDVNNVAQTVTLPVQDAAGTGGTYLANGLMVAAAAKDFFTPVTQIRVKASTTITLKTGTGTYTGVTYSASATIKQVQ